VYSEQGTRNSITLNNDRHPTTEAQRFKYTDKQAKQGNKGEWQIRNTWGN